MAENFSTQFSSLYLHKSAWQKLAGIPCIIYVHIFYTLITITKNHVKFKLEKVLKTKLKNFILEYSF